MRFGDFDVVFEVRSNPKFQREGYDIVTEKEISFPEAALGTEVEVETIDGNLKIKIPAGTQPNTVIRLAGKGVKQLRGSGHGDHYVRIKVVVPKNLTSHQKEMLREFDGNKSKEGWF